jgi:hypothetical protein
MRHFLKLVFSFIPFLAVAYTLLTFFWGTIAPQPLRPNLIYPVNLSGYLCTRLKEVKLVQNIDILFLGSSHAYRGFDTRIFKKNHLETFNLGSSSQTPLQTKVLLTKYLDQLNPKTIIYEVYPYTFSIDGVESSLDLIAHDKNDLNSIKMVLTVNNITVYNSLLYRFIRDPFSFNSSCIESKLDRNNRYIPGGYVEADSSYFQHVDFSKNKWAFNDRQFVIFNDIIKMIKERNIKLILVNAPISVSLYNSYTNNDVFDNKMNSYGIYYNFNKILNLTDSLHFLDSDHLNQSGVQIFNEKLIEIINTIDYLNPQ